VSVASHCAMVSYGLRSYGQTTAVGFAKVGVLIDRDSLDWRCLGLLFNKFMEILQYFQNLS